MELRHLRYFVTVAEELSFSKAAQKLYTAQPSLSQQIKQLEQQFGFALFHRSKRRVELTNEGRYLLPYAKATLQQASESVDKTRLAARQEKNALRIGFVPVAEIKVFPHILPLLRFHHPQLNISLHSWNAIEQQQALEQGDLDIAIIREALDSSSIAHQWILDEEMVFLLPQQHPLSKLAQIPIAALQDSAIVIPSDKHAPTLHQTVKQFFQQHQIRVQYMQEAGNILFNINLVSIGLGCALLPSYVLPIIKHNPAIVVRALDVRLPKIQLYACYSKRYNQANIALFMQQLKLRLHT
jgi:LysR family hca operon transcriptional activator